MNTFRILLVLMAMPIGVLAWHTDLNAAPSAKGPVIEVVDTLNLGEIFIDDLSDEHGKIRISIKNKGAKPLILKNVGGCCGTNVKSWPKAPILPGKEGVVRVEFRIEPRPQRISRTITIESNADNGKIKKVLITGVVLERKKSNEIVL